MFKIIGSSLSDSCFFEPGCKISLSKNEGRVYHYPYKTQPTEKIYQLKIPFLPREMPLDDALDDARQIHWFVSHGYVPKIVDNDTKITLVQESTSEQNLHIQELLKKCEAHISTLARFARHVRNNTLHQAQTEEYQGWLLLLLNDKDEFKTKTDVIFGLLEQCKQSLRSQEWLKVDECLLCLQECTTTAYIFNDLYADFLCFRGSKKAADHYLMLSGNKSEEESIHYLEKAIRCDAEHPNVTAALANVKCCEERVLYCYATAYLACKDKTSQTAEDYFKKARLLCKRVNDEELKAFISPHKSLDQSLNWVPSGPQSTPTSPATTPLMGSYRGSKATARSAKQAGTTMKFVQASESIYKSKLAKDKDNPEHVEGLLWWYDGEKIWLKAEYVARWLYERTSPEKMKRYDFGVALARAMEMLDKKDEAQRLLFELATSEYTQQRRHNALACLTEIYRINSEYGVFSRVEKQIMYLLLLQLQYQDAQAIQALKDKIQGNRSPRQIPDTDLTTINQRGHFGEWAYFQVEHPLYVACAFTVTKKLMFSKNSVEVFSLGNDTPTVYPLEIPPEVPNEIALFGTKRVRWLLSRGYVPEIAGHALRFTNPKSLHSKSVLESKLQTILGETDDVLLRFKENIDSGSLPIAYYYMHKAYTKNPQCLEVAELYAEFLVYSKRQAQALPIFTQLADQTDSDNSKLHYLQRALLCASSIQSEKTEALYNKALRVLQRMQKTQDLKKPLQLLMLHGYLYLQCHQPSKENSMHIFYNKAQGGGDIPLAACAALACEPSSTGKTQRYQNLAEMAKQAPIPLTNIYNYYLLKKELESPSESTLSKLTTPHIPKWQLMFHRLFVKSAPPIIRTWRAAKRPNEDLIATYLDQAEKAQGKFRINGDVQPNSICPVFSSQKLYYLEEALPVACGADDPRAAEIYENIYKKLKTRKEAHAAQFLVCLHAFFYYKAKGSEEQAESFFARAEELNPTSLLFACAKIAHLPQGAKRKKTTIYNEIVHIFESEDHLTEHLASQAACIVPCSLADDLQRECKKVLESMHHTQTTLDCIIAVDTLLERANIRSANILLSKCIPASPAVHKRAAIAHIAAGRLYGLSEALKALQEHYKQTQKPEKLCRVTSLLNKHIERSDAERIRELVLENKRKEAAKFCYEKAFIHFYQEKRDEAAKQLLALQQLGPQEAFFSTEERLILQLLHNLLGLQVQQQSELPDPLELDLDTALTEQLATIDLLDN